MKLSEDRPKSDKELPLAGIEFVITGTLQRLSRAEAEEKIRAQGGAAKSDVTKKTSYLVVGADPGSKVARAQALGIPNIGEADLLKMLDQASTGGLTDKGPVEPDATEQPPADSQQRLL